MHSRAGMRWILGAMVSAGASAALLLGGPSAQASVANAVTLTATPNPVEPGDEVNLIASMPAGDAGTLSQELVQKIDPTKVRLTGISDVIAPDGWFVSVATAVDANGNGTNFTTPKLTDDPTANWAAVNWSAVRVVKASGTILSGGSDNGLQVATGTGTGTTTSNLPGQLSSSTGDGYDPFFNADHTMVFNIPHHASYGAATVDCHVLADGSQCTGFPYPLQVSAGNQSTGRVIGTGANTKLWTVGVRPDTPGSNPTVGDLAFECIDLSRVVAGTGGPTGCTSGGQDRSLITVADQMTWSWIQTNNNNFVWDFRHAYSLWHGFEGVGNEGAASATNTKLWTVNSVLGTLVCVDTAALAPCSGMPAGGWPLGFSTIADPEWDDNATAMWGDFIYVKAHTTGGPFASTSNYRTTCLLASDPTQYCPGWTDNPATTANERFRVMSQTGRFVQLPSADGGTRGVCSLTRATTVVCFDANGNEFAGPSNLVVNAPDGPDIVGQPIRQGTRIYYGNGAGGSWVNYFAISCWDAAANSGAGGGCLGTDANPRLTWSSASWSVPAGQENYAQYSLVPDPVYEDCLWLGQDLASKTLRTINGRTGLPGCNTLSQRVEFDGSPIVPRMGCDTTASGSAIRYWRSFTLVTPASGFATATLSVSDEDGNLIDGWTGIPITAGQRVSLLDLPVSVTGQEPKFTVDLADVTISGTVNASAKVEAVGDAPELCLSPVVQVTCPAGLSGPVSDALLASTLGVMRARAEGSSTLASSTVASTPAEIDVSIAAATTSDCGVVLGGTALEAVSGTGTPVPGSPPVDGVTVTLMNSTGTAPVTYPLDWPDAALRGQPVTTTTAANGSYSFGALAPGSYTVRFADTTDYIAFSAAVKSGSTYGTPVLAGQSLVTSSPVTLAVGSPGVIDATYVLPLTAAPDITYGPVNTNQVAYPLANDTPTSQRTLNGAVVTLCGTGEVAPNCTQTSLTVLGVGTYTVSGTGPTATITFDPEPTFLGTAPAVSYQVTDTWGEVASSTYTPSVFGPVTGVDDAATSAWDSNLLFTPLANDGKDAANAFVASTVKLCGLSPLETQPNCTKSSVAVANEGTYTVNADGSVTFDPLPSFSGTVSQPVTYIVRDLAGQVAHAQIIPTILDPQQPSASPDTAPVLPVSMGGTGTVVFDPLLAPGSGALAYGAGTPTACLVDPTTNQCAAGNSVTIPGEGTYVLNPSTNLVTFTLAAGVTSDVPLTPVTYRVTDFVGQYADSTLTPEIPALPIARNDISSGYQDVNQVISPLINDSAGAPADLDPTSVRLCSSTDVSPNCTAQSLIVPGEGTYTVNTSTGAVTFDPLPTFTGVATSVTYSVTDSVGQKAAALIAPTVLVVPNPADAALPSARTDLASGPYGQPVTLAAKGNDRAGSAPAGSSQTTTSGPTSVTTATSFSDPALDVTSVRLCATGEVLPDCTAMSVTTVDGTYTVDTGTGEVTFTPVDGFTGTVTQPVAYQIANAYTKTVTTTTVETTTTDPTATCVGPGCSFVTVADVNGKSPTDPAWIPTWNVTTVIERSTALSYPATALLIPTIDPPTGPEARDDSTTTTAGTPVTLSPISNDREGGFPLRASSLLLCGTGETAPACTRTTVTIPGQGTFSVNTATGEVTFVPQAGFTGVATVPYRILDWNGDDADAVISVTVGAAPPLPPGSSTPGSDGTGSSQTAPSGSPQPGAPVAALEANDDVNATPTGVSATGSVAMNDVVPAGSTYAIVGAPQNGSVVLSADGSYQYTPSPGFSGRDSFTYRVCAPDASACATATVVVTVAAPRDIVAKPMAKPVAMDSMKPVTYRPQTTADVRSVRIAPIGKGAWGTRVVVPGKGVWTIKGTKVHFTPFRGFVGQATIRYRVVDANGRVAFSTFTAVRPVRPALIDAGL